MLEQAAELRKDQSAFVLAPSDKHLTVATDFFLATASRSLKRSHFNEAVAQRQQEVEVSGTLAASAAACMSSVLCHD